MARIEAFETHLEHYEDWFERHEAAYVSELLAQARRVLRPSGTIAIGFIDLASPLGQQYERHKQESDFYREASFFTADEVERLLLGAGFSILAWAQTLSGPVEPGGPIEAARPGRGDGAFVVVQARNDKP